MVWGLELVHNIMELECLTGIRLAPVSNMPRLAVSKSHHQISVEHIRIAGLELDLFQQI